MQVYAPHTGNPNARRAREQGLQSLRSGSTGDAYHAPYHMPNLSAAGQSLPNSPFHPVDQPVSWNTVPELDLNVVPSRHFSDTSGDESDGDQTTDSLETRFGNTSWETSTAPTPLPSTSAPLSYSLDTSHWGTAYNNSPMLASQGPPNTQPSFTGKQRETAPTSDPVFPSSMLPYSAPSSLTSTSAPEPMDVASTKLEPPPIRLDMPPIGTSDHLAPRRKSTSELSQLCTSNLMPLPSAGGASHVPFTPTRLVNMSLFSPVHFGIPLGSNDLSMWLDEPVVPSPMYETGACTGWTGLISSGVDTGRTPTVTSSRMGLIKGPRLEEDLAHSPRSSTSLSPALISSVDWWAHDYGAQSRFHRYMLSCVSPTNALKSQDCRSTLTASLVSRFLTYCSFLCLRDPGAPQPPFMHRYMLLTQRDKLPASLAIARSALSALAMRLPTSEVWAWRQVGAELSGLVDQARDLVSQYERVQTEGTPLERHLWFQQATSFDGCWECLSLVQALWCYAVVGAFDDSMDPAHKGTAASMAQRVWNPSLLPSAMTVLEQLLCVLASIGTTLQAQSWKCSTVSSNAKSSDTFGFLWWGLCESIRRSVLATHALLVVWQYTRAASEEAHAPAPRLGSPLICQHIPSKVWDHIMQLELPAIASVFEADNVTQWRLNMEKHTTQPGISEQKLSLMMCMQYRPSSASEDRANIPFYLTSYFHHHDEFTNICLCALFGLTES